MIGVLCPPEDAAVLEEFFQLFKTPWEPYEPGRAYDVVLDTTGTVPEVEARLIVVYGTRLSRGDDRLGAAAGIRPNGVRPRGGALDRRGVWLPIYGALLTFVAREPRSVYLATSDGAVAGLKVRAGNVTVVRLGYDLAHEVRVLLAEGQAPEQAGVPTLDLHVALLRGAILDSGLPLLEIPAAPAGYRFAVCLTHDVDFAGIRYHGLDHTLLGFLYRATLGSLARVARGRLSLARCVASWRAALSLPLVYLGWARDFWDPFDWYLRVERGLSATYFVIPFKRRPGERVAARHASRRGAAYDVDDVATTASTLWRHGCELAVHGIDAWHDAERGRRELERIARVSGEPRIGVRMHWLLRDEHTPRVLEDAGYAWDSSIGYNETIGYRSGTTQPFRPPGARSLLELPLHIQDGALFRRGRMDLSEAEAWARCRALIENAETYGGVLTVLWHDRSHGPERFWGDFYVRLVDALAARAAWFGTAGQVVEWFARRRAVRFQRGAAGVRLRYHGEDIISPPLAVRVYRARGEAAEGRERGAAWVDVPWSGRAPDDLDRRLAAAAGVRAVHGVGVGR
jgi:hypothetical protein